MKSNHRSNHIAEVSELEKIRDGLSYLTGEENPSIDQIITDRFILENTDFDSLVNFFDAAGVKNEEDFERPEFNAFIKKHTRFEDWQDMLIHSSNQFVSRSVDLK